MSTSTHQQILARVNELIGFIQQGRILDAMTEFYSDNAAMQENANPPTLGLAANIEREKQFLANVAQFHGFGATAVGIDSDRGIALIESWLDFTDVKGKRNRLEQVSVQKWVDGKIIHERFYYNAG